ncbi:high mobility group box domain-containing protein [Dunaliella salina]|uniref:High mobility group box domain-containing protein n=1 Tax=Dunaliella salina TaxID=3046 RepID=A0ABQ7GE54_DUNSA|nr:high mobility group box domain-containing protein [Dunaliella salina]|eukprot:KAF5832893.1 high mobility group box domain-containing protein [Dunaliella salina]
MCAFMDTFALCVVVQEAPDLQWVHIHLAERPPVAGLEGIAAGTNPRTYDPLAGQPLGTCLQTGTLTNMPKAAATKKQAPKAKPEKGEKKKKDPNAPKRGLSAYMFFCQDMRDTIKAENPEMKVTEVTSELGKQWKELPESEKKQYHDRAAQDKKRYEEESKNYKPPAGEASGKKATPKKAPAKDKGKKREESPAADEGGEEEEEEEEEDDE